MLIVLFLHSGSCFGDLARICKTPSEELESSSSSLTKLEEALVGLRNDSASLEICLFEELIFRWRGVISRTGSGFRFILVPPTSRPMTSKGSATAPIPPIFSG